MTVCPAASAASAKARPRPWLTPVIRKFFVLMYVDPQWSFELHRRSDDGHEDILLPLDVPYEREAPLPAASRCNATLRDNQWPALWPPSTWRISPVTNG